MREERDAERRMPCEGTETQGEDGGRNGSYTVTAKEGRGLPENPQRIWREQGLANTLNLDF